MTERGFFAFFGACCAGALAMIGLMAGAAYAVSLLPDDTPERLEKLGFIRGVSLAEESAVLSDAASDEPYPASEESGEESSGAALAASVTLDLSRGGGKIYLQNETAYKVSARDALDGANAAGDIRGTPPTVLVFHTHGTESYAGSGSDRSENTKENVVAAGEALCDALRSLGIFALHDTNMYDKDDFSAAYAKSRAAAEEWIRRFPAVRYIIDVHRDSVESGGVAAAAVAEVEGRRAAQIMIVVGTDEKAGRHTGWKDNFSLALKLQEELMKISPSLVRPIYLRSASFNQDLSPGALLIEIGTQGNTLEEAEYSAELLANAMASCFSDE